MGYSTQDQVESAVGGPEKLLQLSDLTNGIVPAIDAVVVARAIAEADGVINSVIGHRYAVPLVIVPDMISALSASWAARVLRRNKYNGQTLQDDIDREKIDREWLDNVAKGIYSLGIEPTPLAASIVNDKAGVRDAGASVGRERLKGIW